MPCLLTLLALAAPRLVVALLWFFTHWFRGVFDNILYSANPNEGGLNVYADSLGGLQSDYNASNGYSANGGYNLIGLSSCQFGLGVSGTRVAAGTDGLAAAGLPPGVSPFAGFGASDVAFESLVASARALSACEMEVAAARGVGRGFFAGAVSAVKPAHPTKPRLGFLRTPKIYFDHFRSHYTFHRRYTRP